MANKEFEDVEVTETDAPAVEVTETDAPAVEVTETDAPAVEDETEPNVLEKALDAVENVVESGFEYAEGLCKKTLDVFFGRTKHVEPE